MRWMEEARPEQIAPIESEVGAWNIWFLMTGRGWGKTRTGAQDIIKFACMNPNTLSAVVAPTWGELHRHCFYGESGLKPNIPQDCYLKGSKGFNESRLEITLWNGARIHGYSAEAYETLRGDNFHRAWLDELASWQHQQKAFDNLMFALRGKIPGSDEGPKVIITSTPKPSRMIKDLIEDSFTQLQRGKTFDNSSNLAPASLDTLQRMYGGTTIGRQELHGELLDATEGALWNDDIIESNRVSKKDVPDLVRVVVAIDPANTSTENAAETGIIVAGLGVDDCYYVLDDVSIRSTPHGWASQAVKAYHTYKADKIVAEVNSGGEMIGANISTIESDLPYKAIWASRGKITRAEPIASLYEKGQVKHVGLFQELEDQMTSYVAGAGKSPDRMDALVWALTWLYTGPGEAYFKINVL